jgi:mono/diheme cytochrome c family protein
MMKTPLKKLVVATFGVSMLAACYMGVGSGADQNGNGTNPNNPSTSNPTNNGTCAADPWGACEALLAAKCQSCHGATLSGGAPMALMTANDLKAPSKTNPSLNNVQLSIQRMQANTMPPGGGGQSDIAVLQAWIDQGYPAANPNACDGGTPTYEAGPDPYNTPVQCSSNKQGTHQKEGNATMNPGEDCMDCHQVGGNNERQFIIAGTVYKTAHEPNDCAGVATGYTVSGVDKNNAKWSATVNSAGNFYVQAGTVTPPLSNIIVKDSNGKTRPMAEAAPAGNCNACHTVSGAAPYAPGFATKAPGRVMAP